MINDIKTVKNKCIQRGELRIYWGIVLSNSNKSKQIYIKSYLT